MGEVVTARKRLKRKNRRRKSRLPQTTPPIHCRNGMKLKTIMHRREEGYREEYQCVLCGGRVWIDEKSKVLFS